MSYYTFGQNGWFDDETKEDESWWEYLFPEQQAEGLKAILGMIVDPARKAAQAEVQRQADVARRDVERQGATAEARVTEKAVNAAVLVALLGLGFWFWAKR